MIGISMVLAMILTVDDRPFETWDVPCPSSARGVVTPSPAGAGGQPMEWTATPQSSSVQSASIEDIGGAPALVCHYSMFDHDYWIWMRPPAQVPFCEVLAGATRPMFLCNNGGRRS